MVASRGGKGVVHATGVCMNSALQMSVGVPPDGGVGEEEGITGIEAVMLGIGACCVRGEQALNSSKRTAANGKRELFFIVCIL
jgi:hypothetical protein